MKILITGTGGFIAGNVATWLEKNTSHTIIGTYRNRKPKKGNYQTVQCDLFLNPEKLKEIDFDVVVHFASQMYGEDIKDFLDNTVQATRNLLEIAEEKQVDRFIYMSTISICGETEGVITEEARRINQRDYEMVKWIGERLVACSTIKNKTCIRLPRVLGPDVDYSAVWLPKVSDMIRKGEEIKYYNPDSPYNTLLHVDSLARFIFDIIEERIKDDVYVLGADEPMTILTILEFLKKGLNSDSVLTEVQVDAPDRCHSVDISKAKKAGYVSDTVQEVLEKYVDDMRGE